MSDINTRLWERAEAAIEIGLRVSATPNARHLAQLATVALLRELSSEITATEEDDVDWPDAGDLTILADNLEARVDGVS